MIKARFLIVALFAPLFCLMTWAVFLNFQKTTSQEVRVFITGYDPRDLLSGRYIAYQVDWEKTDCTQFKNNICPENEFCKEARWGRECRFYVPEKDARALDSLFSRRFSDDYVFEVIYAYHQGFEPIAKELLVNGQDYKDALNRERLKKKDLE